jgi:hypothetical protein
MTGVERASVTRSMTPPGRRNLRTPTVEGVRSRSGDEPMARALRIR